MSEKKLREKFIFVNDIPLIVFERNANRQMQIEIWLEPDILAKALNLVKLRECQKESKPEPKLDYIV
jgi:hypothetical protein